MHHFGQLPAAPCTIRIGVWLAVGAYLLSFALPAREGGAMWGGAGLFASGIVGLVMALASPGILFLLTPWLANPLVWFALIHLCLRNGRAAFRAALTATLLALTYLGVAGVASGGLGGFFVASPAYFAWLGSMVLLTISTARLARHEERSRLDWDPVLLDALDAEELTLTWQERRARSTSVRPGAPAWSCREADASFFFRTTGKIR